MDTGLFVLAVSILLASYGGMHYYLYRKLLWVFPRHRKLITASLSFLASSLFIAEALTHTGFSRAVAPLSWVANMWTGYVFIFFSVAGTLDVATKLLSFLHDKGAPTRFQQRTKGILSIGIALLVSIAGLVSARQINILAYTLATSRLQQPVTIAQISDLHINLLSSKARLRALVDRINALHPDIIVSTGDLVDMQLDHLDGFSSVLADLNARLGKYAVYGNHEALAGTDRSKAFTERSGFALLSNHGVTLDHLINIVGIDDPAVHGKIRVSEEQEKRLLAKFPPELFTVLLKHRPVIATETRGMFDLQLSGHTHGGQIFPFTLLTRIFYPAPFGLSRIGTESWLYVSKGTGTWGPPMRVLAKPEVSVFYLRPQ